MMKHRINFASPPSLPSPHPPPHPPLPSSSALATNNYELPGRESSPLPLPLPLSTPSLRSLSPTILAAENFEWQPLSLTARFLVRRLRGVDLRVA